MSSFQTVAGALIVSIVSWVIILSVGVAVFHGPLPAGLLANFSKVVEEGAKAVIRRLLLICLIVFGVISLIFLIQLSWRFSVSLFLSAMVSVCVAAFVLRTSTAAHGRCAIATAKSQLSGFETALHSSIVVGIAVMAPVVMWLALMNLAFSFDRLVSTSVLFVLPLNDHSL